jgi:hypothetical protein
LTAGACLQRMHSLRLQRRGWQCAACIWSIWSCLHISVCGAVHKTAPTARPAPLRHGGCYCIITCNMCTPCVASAPDLAQNFPLFAAPSAPPLCSCMQAAQPDRDSSSHTRLCTSAAGSALSWPWPMGWNVSAEVHLDHDGEIDFDERILRRWVQLASGRCRSLA